MIATATIRGHRPDRCRSAPPARRPGV